ncbi:hypothetical protein EYF80_052763 [Liparis tanakae]|uniref:Uncharacterized protein n=1 Tax=Liparis tanakae TaxID=230148 RepID=A0A4Z2F7E6_9TELE|nr:hypothetical protein EYF80_052763 [Liparis tanakae]
MDPEAVPDLGRHVEHHGHDGRVVVAVDDEAHFTEFPAEVGGVLRELTEAIGTWRDEQIHQRLQRQSVFKGRRAATNQLGRARQNQAGHTTAVPITTTRGNRTYDVFIASARLGTRCTRRSPAPSRPPLFPGRSPLRGVASWHLPMVVPSSPMMLFMELMICCTTGGDMESAYRALCEWRRR